jgi:hypothetical protein
VGLAALVPHPTSSPAMTRACLVIWCCGSARQLGPAGVGKRPATCVTVLRAGTAQAAGSMKKGSTGTIKRTQSDQRLLDAVMFQKLNDDDDDDSSPP